MAKHFLPLLFLPLYLAACTPSLEDQLEEMANEPPTSSTPTAATSGDRPPELYPDHLVDLKIIVLTDEEEDYIDSITGKPNVILDEKDQGKERLSLIMQESERVKYFCSDRYDPAYYPFGLSFKRYILEMRADTSTFIERRIEGVKMAGESCRTDCPELYPVYARTPKSRQDCAYEYRGKASLKNRAGTSD